MFYLWSLVFPSSSGCNSKPFIHSPTSGSLSGIPVPSNAFQKVQSCTREITRSHKLLYPLSAGWRITWTLPTLRHIINIIRHFNSNNVLKLSALHCIAHTQLCQSIPSWQNNVLPFHWSKHTIILLSFEMLKTSVLNATLKKKTTTSYTVSTALSHYFPEIFRENWTFFIRSVKFSSRFTVHHLSVQAGTRGSCFTIQTWS